MFKRYAIFYTPPPGAFAEFCASWLGWDSRHGVTVQHPAINSIDIATLTQTPRKYGFHGTLKAPFRLAASETADDLKMAIIALAQTAKPISLDAMSLQHKHGFLALRPVGNTAALSQFATRLVTDLDRFRAPAAAEELARRRQTGLTERQDRNLMTWGYPFVMEDFHFHLTLSGRIDTATAKTVAQRLDPILTRLVPRPFMIDHIALVGQADDDMFHEIQRYALAG